MGDTEQPRYTGFRGLSVRGISALQCINIWNFNVSLTNDVISFEQPGQIFKLQLFNSDYVHVLAKTWIFLQFFIS